MADYRLSITILSRGGGASSVAKAAYRAAECITSEHDGQTHDYTRKGGVVHTEIMLPDHAPREYADRAALWNAVEKSERYKTAQLAREIQISLPRELTQEQNIDLAHAFVQEVFVNAGMCADLCVHDNGDGNPHSHIMLTMRPIEQDGAWGAKSRTVGGRKINTVDWNDRDKAEEWRKAWEDFQNAALGKHGFDVRVDHRSYVRQGVEQIPTVHLGVAASQMEKRGIRTERGDQNRAIAVTNQMIRQLRARVRKIENWIYSQPIQDVPTMGDMLSAVNRVQNFKSQWQRIRNLQRSAQVLLFIQQNGLYTVEQLADKITELHQEQYDLAGDVKKKERRITTLTEHLAQVDIYKQHTAVYKKYKNLAPKKDAALNSLNPFAKSKAAKDHEAAVKKQNAYYEKHAGELEQYESAATYLKDHLNGYDKIPEKEWRAELDGLLTGRYAQVERYYKLSDDVKNAETLRRGAEHHMRDITPEHEPPTKAQDVAL